MPSNTNQIPRNDRRTETTKSCPDADAGVRKIKCDARGRINGRDRLELRGAALQSVHLHREISARRSNRPRLEFPIRYSLTFREFNRGFVHFQRGPDSGLDGALDPGVFEGGMLSGKVRLFVPLGLLDVLLQQMQLTG